jgi:hypothetical protein
MTKNEAKELRKEFPYLTVNRIQRIAESPRYKTMRGAKSAMRKANAELAELDNIGGSSEVVRVEVHIDWKHNPTWGFCPRATANYTRKDGSWGECHAYASGCGYDKASQVVAEVLNQCIRYKLWQKRNSRKKPPYGITLSKEYLPYFSGGIGMGCYPAITSFLGGKMTHVADRPNYDYYLFEF